MSGITKTINSFTLISYVVVYVRSVIITKLEVTRSLAIGAKTSRLVISRGHNTACRVCCVHGFSIGMFLSQIRQSVPVSGVRPRKFLNQVQRETKEGIIGTAPHSHGEGKSTYNASIAILNQSWLTTFLQHLQGGSN